MVQEWSARMKPLQNDKFEDFFNASMKEGGTILASQGSYGQIEGRPLKRGFHGAIPTIKLERIEPFERHELETHSNAMRKCKKATFLV